MAAKQPSSTARQAQDTARDGSNVRERISKLTTDALRDRKLRLSDLPGLAAEVMDGAVMGIKEAVPQDQGNVLRQVVDGLGDAYYAAANAATGAVKSARKHGSEFVNKDVKGTARDVKNIQEEVFDTVGAFGHRLSDELSRELKSVVSRAKRAGSAAGPSVRGAAGAADGRLVELTGEVASAGAKVAKHAAGSVMLAASGLLEGLAATINTPAKRAAKPAKKSAPKKKSAAKKAPAKKASAKKAAKKSAARKK
jgi:hypothetical protein